MAQYGFFYDNTRCTGCKTCVMACKDYYDSPLDIARRKVYDIEGGQWKGDEGGAYTTDSFLYHLSIGCQHCDNPACVDVCPTTAMHQGSQGRYRQGRHHQVHGLRLLRHGLPVQLAADRPRDRPCRQVRGVLGTPGCGQDTRVRERCPLRALDSGPIDELKAKYGDVRQIYPLVDPSMTEPNFVIKPSPTSELPYVESGYVSNPEEV